MAQGSTRFENLEKPIDDYIIEQQNKNTRVKTTRDVKLLIEFLREKHDQRNPEDIEAEELNEYLCEFILSVKRKDGKDFEPSSLRGQYFAYLIVLDFESTCWKVKKLSYGPEIIEFPAVLLNTSTGLLESEFHMFVQPTEHRKLSMFCTELTGITQSQVDEGVPIGTCLMLFGRWLQEMRDKNSLKFPCDQVRKKDQEENMEISGNWCTFVTWSDWDLGNCLKNECYRKQLRMPQPLRSWIDLRATYKNFYSRKPQGLAGALQDLGIQFSGREHSGLDDARNTARLAWRMISDGCVMQIT